MAQSHCIKNTKATSLWLERHLVVIPVFVLIFSHLVDQLTITRPLHGSPGGKTYCHFIAVLKLASRTATACDWLQTWSLPWKQPFQKQEDLLAIAVVAGWLPGSPIVSLFLVCVAIFTLSLLLGEYLVSADKLLSSKLWSTEDICQCSIADLFVTNFSVWLPVSEYTFFPSDWWSRAGCWSVFRPAWMRHKKSKLSPFFTFLTFYLLTLK